MQIANCKPSSLLDSLFAIGAIIDCAGLHCVVVNRFSYNCRAQGLRIMRWLDGAVVYTDNTDGNGEEGGGREADGMREEEWE